MRLGVWGQGFRVQGLGFRVQGFKFRVKGLGFVVQGFRFTGPCGRGGEFGVRNKDEESGGWGLGVKIEGLVIRVGFRVQGLRFRI